MSKAKELPPFLIMVEQCTVQLNHIIKLIDRFLLILKLLRDINEKTDVDRTNNPLSITLRLIMIYYLDKLNQQLKKFLLFHFNGTKDMVLQDSDIYMATLAALYTDYVILCYFKMPIFEQRRNFQPGFSLIR